MLVFFIVPCTVNFLSGIITAMCFVEYICSIESVNLVNVYNGNIVVTVTLYNYSGANVMLILFMHQCIDMALQITQGKYFCFLILISVFFLCNSLHSEGYTSICSQQVYGCQNLPYS